MLDDDAWPTVSTGDRVKLPTTTAACISAFAMGKDHCDTKESEHDRSRVMLMGTEPDANGFNRGDGMRTAIAVYGVSVGDPFSCTTARQAAGVGVPTARSGNGKDDSDCEGMSLNSSSNTRPGIGPSIGCSVSGEKVEY